MDDASRVGLFISYADRDRAWAEWVAWHLAAAGHTVELDVWDWSAGDNVVLRASDALDRRDRVVALWSSSYFERDSPTTELWASVARMRQRLVPLRIEPVDPPSILAAMSSCDLFDLGEAEARQALVSAVGGSTRPDVAPAFPGVSAEAKGPRKPGSLPPVWNVAPRSPMFTGRDAMVARLRELLQSGGATAVYALHGIGGVGKTQLAIEYVHRFAGDYTLVWWINAERPDLIDDQVAGLATAARLVSPGTDTPTSVGAVRTYLRGHDRWLIVFDNVASASDVAGRVPAGPGHVIITSRSPTWTGVAGRLPVDIFDRGESVAMLSSQIPGLTDDDATTVAAELGDLPLALAQAAGVIIETGMSASDYLEALAASTDAVLAAGAPPDYPVALAGSVRVAAARLAEVDPAAGHLISLCAHLGPEPIPIWLFATRDGIPSPLADIVARGFALRTCVGHAVRYGLIHADTHTLTMHRLTQAALRSGQSSEVHATGRATIEAMLVATRPDDSTDPVLWPRWAQLLPHILAVDPAGTTDRGLMSLACSAVWHLRARGDYRTALPLATLLYEQWRQRLGPDDHHALWAATNLAATLHGLGQYERARELDEDTLTRDRRVLGEDHVDTLHSANNLAIHLRALDQHERARELDEDTLSRRRRLLGDDHVDTLKSANNLALDLHALGQHERARQLDEDTLTRLRRVLGDDHSDTLSSAGNLARDLYALGQYEQARQLGEDTMISLRRVLGADHPTTLTAANNLARDLSALGQHERARGLGEDTLAGRQRVLGEDHPDTLRSASNLAHDLRALGQHERAQQLEEEVERRRARSDTE